MDLERYFSIAREHASAFTGIVTDAVSGHIIGGWQGVLTLAGCALLMFILTKLLSPRQ